MNQSPLWRPRASSPLRLGSAVAVDAGAPAGGGSFYIHPTGPARPQRVGTAVMARPAGPPNTGALAALAPAGFRG